MTHAVLEPLVLGFVQGVTEWLPISSEGAIVLVETLLFHRTESLSALIRYALFLHLGTALAVAIYFRRDVVQLLRAVARYAIADDSTKTVLRFLLVSTLISGVLGIAALKLLEGLETHIVLTGRLLTCGVGVLLLVTGWLQWTVRERQAKSVTALRSVDSLVLGVAQGLAILPGLSRSGLTISALLLRGFEDTVALRLSFLMSLPIVLGGNMLLNWRELAPSGPALLAMTVACITGLLMMHGLLVVARRVNLGPFVVGFGILMLLAAALP